MKSVKRIGAWILALILAVQLIPAASAGNLTSDRAKSYLKAIDSKPSANSYLVDFDGDGNDELMLIQAKGGNSYDTEYEVWIGQTKAIASSFGTYLEGKLYTHENDEALYLGISGTRHVEVVFDLYTIKDGKWTKEDNFYEAYDVPTDNSTYYINGKLVTHAQYQSGRDQYREKGTLSSSHSVRNQLVNTVDTTIKGYKDVLSSLSSSEKTALYDRLLCNVLVSLSVPGDFDSRTASDAQLIECLEFMELNTQFPFADYGGRETNEYISTIFRKEDFTRLTTELFGRTLDYSKITRTTRPDVYEYSTFMYKNQVYLMRIQSGYIMEDRAQAQHIYALGGGKYYTTFKHWQKEPEGKEQVDGIYGAVVKKNPNNTWTLIRLYPKGYTPTEAELDAYVQPSSWAKTEVEAADAAGLIPTLTGDPAYQDAATRLQFAQLAVQYVEKALGKTLPAAPSGTFADCQDTAVRKAHQAGLVNGTSDTDFSPEQALTREQLATMLWRTIAYVQAETGKHVYPQPGSLAGFSDKGQVSAWAVDGMGRLAANGVMKGTSDTTLSPKASCTVEQSILLVYRVYLAMQ